MTTDLLSIVTPTRNRLPWLQEMVASVFDQTVDSWELIIIDDSSDDGTGAWLETIDEPRVRAHTLTAYAGVGGWDRSRAQRARNTGLQAAAGGFVTFLDDDDLLEKHALETHVAAFDRYPRAIASVGGYTSFGVDHPEVAVRMVGRAVLTDVEHPLLFDWVPTGGQSMFRITAARQVGGWDERYFFAQDHDLWLRLARLGPVVVGPELVMRYRVHGQTMPERGDEIMTEIRERAVEKLSGARRARAEKVLLARRLRRKAEGHYARAEAFRAFRDYARICRLAPAVARSPLTRRRVVLPMAKCLVGSWGLRWARKLRRR